MRQSKILAVLLSLLLVPALAGCQPQDGPVKANDPDAPQLNSAPKHKVRIFGTVAPVLEMKLSAAYEVASTKSDCWTESPLWYGGGEKFKNERLKLKRNGNNFEAQLLVDKYLPGRCDWRLIAVNVTIVHKEKNLGYSHVAIEARQMYEDENLPGCDPSNDRCSEAQRRVMSNSNETIPLEMRCRSYFPDESIDGKPGYQCNDSFDFSYKKYHLIKPQTRQAELHIIDLDAQKKANFPTQSNIPITQENQP